MTDIVNEMPVQIQRPPARAKGAGGWARENLFSGIFNSILTLLCIGLLAVAIPPLIRWAFIDAIWHAPSGAACHGGGACWAFIGEKMRFILFGFFPSGEIWRPILVVVIFLLMIVGSCDRRTWGRRLVGLWAAGLLAVYLLMHGGFAGLGTVETRLWSGLPLTLIIAVVAMIFAFPLAILLALGRRSRLPAVRAICIGYIELIRGVPLITFLFMASLMLPLFLPAGVTVDKLLRAQIAFILFAAAYLAEVVRGGLQAIPRGQLEAADALGLSYVQRTRLILLPQALALVIPPLVNTFIGFFKDTSLVLIIGIFDLLTAAKTSIIEPAWQSFSLEVYIVVGIIYFAFCFAMSRYSHRLETELNRSARH